MVGNRGFPVEVIRRFSEECAEVDDLKKTVPKEKLDAFFESELRQRYGISSADLNIRYGNAS